MNPAPLVESVRLVWHLCATCLCQSPGDCMDWGGVVAGLGALSAAAAAGGIGQSATGTDPGSDSTGSVSRDFEDPRDLQRDRIVRHFDDEKDSWRFKFNQDVMQLYRWYEKASEAIGGVDEKTSLCGCSRG